VRALSQRNSVERVPQVGKDVPPILDEVPSAFDDARFR
jgi:hypothetical protein